MFLQERFLHLAVYGRPLAGCIGRCKMEMCSWRNTRVLGLPTPPDRVNPSGGTSRLFLRSVPGGTHWRFWLDQSTARGSRLGGAALLASESLRGAFSLGNGVGRARSVPAGTFRRFAWVDWSGSLCKMEKCSWRNTVENSYSRSKIG